ncbi:hypothetical protein PR048_005727 [Dryococelus australis]|uniref:Uncharacterized protein n=1 Tax=Dryococelus australis TaxID=614101 RepID=A0ABQ9I8Z9_9NEOP|nr:hypothetical protein PR048_005727 [Dryococelus australis]
MPAGGSLNTGVVKADERGKWKIPEKTCRPMASSDTIPKYENLVATPPSKRRQFQEKQAKPTTSKPNCCRYAQRVDPSVKDGQERRKHSVKELCTEGIKDYKELANQLGFNFEIIMLATDSHSVHFPLFFSTFYSPVAVLDPDSLWSMKLQSSVFGSIRLLLSCLYKHIHPRATPSRIGSKQKQVPFEVLRTDIILCMRQPVSNFRVTWTDNH